MSLESCRSVDEVPFKIGSGPTSGSKDIGSEAIGTKMRNYFVLTFKRPNLLSYYSCALFPLFPGMGKSQKRPHSLPPIKNTQNFHIVSTVQPTQNIKYYSLFQFLIYCFIQGCVDMFFPRWVLVAHGAGAGCSPASPLISVPWWAAFLSWVLSEVKIGAGPIGIFMEIMCAEVFARLVDTRIPSTWSSVVSGQNTERNY